MQFGFTCLQCLIEMQLRRIRNEADSAKKLACAKELLDVITGAPEGVAAPWVIPHCNAAIRKWFGGPEDPLLDLKQKSNAIMLDRLPAIREQVLQAEDPLRAALLYCRVGNYIDFGALGENLSFDRLDELLADAESAPLDEAEYAQLRSELSRAKKLLYLADNAGEIVLDRLTLEVLRQEYPELEITLCVRGGPALNDALREDALQAGADAFARIIDNGSAIPGTEPDYLGPEAKAALTSADVILSKGQGNLETLLGCGYNIYYLFLCKCSHFTELFHVPAMTGMLLNERRITIRDILC